ncbi:MAG: NADH:flavin oxidoreductase/NADH oxidase family protein [Polyangiales bacterium]
MADLRVAEPFVFSNGARSKNRFFKSAMSEALAGDDNRVPVERMERLYGAWARGGTGIIVTGNVMVDRRALGEPGNVVVEDARDSEALARWARFGTKTGAQLWMQLNHPGKQCPIGLNRESVAPSAVPFAKELRALFATPRALEEREIRALIERFATSAAIVREAGFSGVQIHGAHGYLVSQFLSPKHNVRDDDWGGTPAKRMRFVREVYAAIRRKCGADFTIGVKLNSADFQRGGFTEDESLAVIEALSDDGINCVEISGGTYEAAAMMGAKQSERTREREAYFIDFARKVREKVKTPLVVTGGFRTLDGMEKALASGATDFIGLARPLASEPDLPDRLLRGEATASKVAPVKTGIGFVDSRALPEISFYEAQIRRIADGQPLLDSPNGARALWEMAIYAVKNAGRRNRA